MGSLTIKEGLCQALSNLNDVHGLFSCFGVLESCPNPVLHIEGLGTIGLPLSERDAKSISQSPATQQSPFGKGTETKVDASVRKSWQINPGQFELRNPKFRPQVNVLTQKVAKELNVACGPENVVPQLYKLLLYEEGSFFLPHQDSEKVDGMFGTLTICLPSKHTGGDVELYHDGNRKVFRSSESSEFDYSYAAWYADVTHEIKPVTSGYRLVLIYNLVQTNSAPRTSASILTSSTSRLKAILSQWNFASKFDQDDCPRFLAYKMSHKYTKAALSFASLKGPDHKNVEHLTKAVRDDEFVLYLAHIEKEVMGGCEEYENGYGSRPWDYYDNELDTSASDGEASSGSSYDDGSCHKIDEVFSSELKLTRVVDLNGQVVGTNINIEVEDIAQGNIFKRAPDDEEYSGYTGNEGVSTTHFFRDTVIILIPQKSLVDFRFSSTEIQWDPQSWLRDLQTEFSCSGKESAREQLVQLCSLILERNRTARKSKYGYGYSSRAPFDDSVVSQAAIAALQLDDVVLFEEAVTEIKDEPSLELFEEVREGISRLGFSSLIPGTTRAVARCKRISQKWPALLIVGRSTFPENIRKSEGVDPLLRNWIMDQVLALLHTVEIVDEKDGTAVAEVAEKYGHDMLSNHVVPFVEKRVNETPFALAFVDRLFALRGSDPLSAETIGNVYSQILTAALNYFDLKIQPEEKTLGHPWYSGPPNGTGVFQNGRYQILPPNKPVDPAPPITAERLLQIFRQCTALSLENMVVILLKKIEESAGTALTTVFQKIMLPYVSSLLAYLQETNSTSILGQECGQHLHEILQQYILRWVEEAPRRSADWSRAADFIACDCTDCASLKAFIQDPIRKESHLSIGQQRRRHLENNFTGKVGYTHTTIHAIRAGSAHTLVIVKNDEEYSSLFAEWKSRVATAKKALLELASNPWLKKLLSDKYEEIMDLKILGKARTATGAVRSKPLHPLQNLPTPAQDNTKKRKLDPATSSDVKNKKQRQVEVVDLTAD